ncbi:MAG: CmpA/NrtA family ABC transporter substrate-binding protein [Verrucomicrobiota bacterium]|nr:CmpA/NrtA family ABC transporter substrate-binding protein [Verrucomicrobiota bacterium]
MNDYSASGSRLKLGFISLVDCAPLVIAKECGFYKKFDIDVELSREVGWNTLLEKVISGRLDASHALASMPLTASLGLGGSAEPCATSLVLNLQGNSLVISKALYQAGVRTNIDLKQYILSAKKVLTFGVVYQYSSHHYLLREWFKQAGINPDRDVRIVVLPPVQMSVFLKSGNLDGYCVGEPWGTDAIFAGLGYCVKVGPELAKGHPEKVLIFRNAFLNSNHNQIVRLTAALLEACVFCDKQENRLEVVNILSRPEYLSISREHLANSLIGPFSRGMKEQGPEGIHIFNRFDANAPTFEKSEWISKSLLALHPGLSFKREMVHECYRLDIFEEASRLALTDMAVASA